MLLDNTAKAEAKEVASVIEQKVPKKSKPAADKSTAVKPATKPAGTGKPKGRPKKTAQ